jgi:lysylphosphatidylglycerol synthetase-like protein (DUF2156 family)
LNVQFSTRPYLPALIVSIILFIAVFLPWLSVDLGFGFGTVTANGTEDWGPLTMIMSILGVVLSFLAVERARALGLVIAGVLALIGVILYWIHIEGAGIGFGIILALIASIALLGVGYLALRKAQSPAPPAPPTPPAQ